MNGAVHRVGGPAVIHECQTRFPHGLKPGDAGWTTAGNLPARWIIHTVAPDFAAGQGDRLLLESCFRRTLEAADALAARTIAIPLIGTGASGWPRQEVIHTAIEVMATTPTRIQEAKLAYLDTAADEEIWIELHLVVPLKIMAAVRILHRRGYQQLRIWPGMSNSGAYWRVSVADASAVDPERYEPSSERHIFYTTGMSSTFENFEVTAATSAPAVADMILASLPRLDRPLPDLAYASWFEALMQLVEEHHAPPVAYAEYFDYQRGWRIGWGPDVWHPAPPSSPWITESP